MAASQRITTIDSDEEIDIFEDASDEKSKNTVKLRENAANTVFNEGFRFIDDQEADGSNWILQKHIKDSAKGVKSPWSLEDRILTTRKSIKASGIMQPSDVSDDTFTQFYITSKEDATEESEGCNFRAVTKQERFDKVCESEDDNNFFESPPPPVPFENFSKLNLSRPILRAIHELGFQKPTQIQCSTIPIALLGKDICACAATGTGKTAAFMLPILERLLFRPKQVPVTRVLVLAPTRELAIQVHSVSRSLAKYLDIQICLIAGGLRIKDQESSLRKEPDVIIATPGRLVDHLHNTPSFGLQNIEILVLDEADRMLEEHFEEQMKEIVKQCQKGRQTMLFSATMTDKVEELVSLSLNHPVRIFIDQNTNVASCLQQEFVRIRANREDDRMAIVAGKHFTEHLVFFLSFFLTPKYILFVYVGTCNMYSRCQLKMFLCCCLCFFIDTLFFFVALCCRNFNKHCLVFCQTKKLAHHFRIVLGLFGLRSGELHGDLNQMQRLEALDLFKNGNIDVLVATDLVARGLDIPGVMTVISFNMPSSFKSYIHRVGRTARAGKFGRSITLVGEKERKNLKLACKTSSVPVKHRIVSSEIVEFFKGKLKYCEKNVAEILKEEEEAKQIRMSEMEMTKAKNILIHHDEIMSRPRKSWIQKESNQKSMQREAKFEKRSRDEVAATKQQEYMKRSIKRERKPQRLRACGTLDSGKNFGKERVKVKRLRTNMCNLKKEPTDSSRKLLKQFHSRPNLIRARKDAGAFKSKKKFKRR